MLRRVVNKGWVEAGVLTFKDTKESELKEFGWWKGCQTKKEFSWEGEAQAMGSGEWKENTKYKTIQYNC